ncbi:peptidase M23, partial [Candidatus Pelagibacter sp.]|nr:peptidase M23 [Candidatus Pelagibacter sp.]
MIFSSNKIIKIIKKNIEITFLILLLLITISSTSIYNEKKVLTDENYKNLINNIYFQKSINIIFDNLVPRYKNIDH